MADFRAIYRLGWKEALKLPSVEFLALAYRCSAYEGVMRARVQHATEREARNVRKPDARIVKSEKIEILADPLLRDVIDFN